MSGENNPHFNPVNEPPSGPPGTPDRLTAKAAYLRDHPRVMVLFSEFTDPTLADMKRFNDALEVIERRAPER